MRAPRKPNRTPSLLPFVVTALVLLVIYGGLLLLPPGRARVNRQDCVATGRTDCQPSRRVERGPVDPR